MDIEEKTLRLTTLELALEEIERIIEGMKRAEKPHSEVNEFVKKRWEIWNEIYQVKKA